MDDDPVATSTGGGFIRVSNWLIDDSDLTANELLVYVVLLRFRDHKTGLCYPGQKAIADRARISCKTVQRAIKSLEYRGIVQVQRRSTLTDPTTNLYRVALHDEDVKDGSARGTRIPKRAKRAVTPESSVHTHGAPSEPKDSESTPKDSESTAPRTPSRPNKIHYNKTQEQAVRLTPPRERASEGFYFEEERATTKQVDYLRDLYVHLHNIVAPKPEIDRWSQLGEGDASQLIDEYLRAMPRHGEYQGPEAGTPEYQELSETGKDWADRGMIPDRDRNLEPARERRRRSEADREPTNLADIFKQFPASS